ncbi:MAG: polysaccharide deacetylase family protein [Parcubacteria group bacterium]
MQAILTFDLEFWYDSEFLKDYVPPDAETRPDYVLESTELLLDLLKKQNVKATFFVLGKLAEKYPGLIKKIFDEGHEIASHGYSHKTLPDLKEGDFEREIALTNEILKQITGKNPTLFRAPAFSLKHDDLQSLNILKKYNLENISKHPALAGGIYFRIMTLRLFSCYLKAASGRKIPILYFHPHEFFKESPKINDGPLFKRKIKYIGTNNAWEKFKKMMILFQFVSIKQYYESATD